jgi:hypothetical protein
VVVDLEVVEVVATGDDRAQGGGLMTAGFPSFSRWSWSWPEP